MVIGLRLGRVASPNGSRQRLPTVHSPKVNLCSGFGLKSLVAISSSSGFRFHQREIPTGKRQERRPVRAGRVSAAMLAKSKLTIDESGLNRWKLRRTKIPLAQKLEHWPGSDSSHETALLIQPFALRTWSLRGAVT